MPHPTKHPPMLCSRLPGGSQGLSVPGSLCPRVSEVSMLLEQLLRRQHSPIPTSLNPAGSGTRPAPFHHNFSHPEDFCQVGDHQTSPCKACRGWRRAVLINLSQWQSVLLSSFPSLQRQSFISLHTWSQFTRPCCELTLPGVNDLQQKSCIMERDEILPFSLLLVCSKAVLKREGKEKKKADFFFSLFLCSSPFLTKPSLRT